MSATRNRLLARWGGGFFEVDFAPDVAAYGQRGGYVGITNVDNGVGAFWTALNTSDLVRIPRQSVVLEIQPTTGDEPVTNYNVGDRIRALNSSGVLTSYRVAAISGSEDENGFIAWAVELTTARQVQEKLDRKWLTLIANGMLEGRAPGRLTLPSGVESGATNVDEYSFSVGGMTATTVGDRGTPTRPRQPSLVYRFELECDTIGVSGSTAAKVLVDDVQIGSSVSMASGAESAFFDLTNPVLVDETNLINVETTAAGGHLGANLTVLAVPTR